MLHMMLDQGGVFRSILERIVTERAQGLLEVNARINLEKLHHQQGLDSIHNTFGTHKRIPFASRWQPAEA
eukprot:1292885-Amphidinium_carterae.1